MQCYIAKSGRKTLHSRKLYEDLARDIIHDQKTIYGSWVTNIWRIEELVERLVRWNIKPESLITHRFKLKEVSKAYSLMASGKCCKVAVVFDDEIQ